ncbi:hemolysin family protein [candidate division KSB1 bacterium]
MTETTIVIVLASLLGSAFFSGAETAIISANPAWITHHSTQGRRWARFLAGCLENPGAFLTTVLVGTNISNVIAAALVTDMVTRRAGLWAVGLSSVVLSAIMLFACELFPKTFCRYHPNISARAAAHPLRLMSIVLGPFSWTVNAMHRFLIRLLPGSDVSAGDLLRRENLMHLAESSAAEGLLHKNESDIIGRVMELGEVRISQVMIPLAQTRCLSVDSSLAAAREYCARTGHSHYPVYREKRPQVVGILPADRLLWADEEVRLKELLEPPQFVAADVYIDDFLSEFQVSGQQLALVRDEAGETIGIVTLRDLIEAVVGKIA